jgi:hypothetical protein
MSTINGKSYQDPRNINLKGGARGTGLIRWTPPQSGVPALWSSNPFSSDDYGLYLNASGQLVFSSLGTGTVLGSGGGGGGVPTWEQIFALDSTFAKATTWTIDNSSGNADVLTLTNSGAGSGACIQITNSGSGADIDGTSNTWTVSKTGVAAFLSVAAANVTGAGAGLTLSDSGANVITIGANTNTITMAKATTFSSSITMTDGLTTLISTSNVAANLLVTNNTITTFGAAAASAGVAVFRSTSLTTGSLLRLQLTEGTLTTGNYIDCYDVTGGGLVFEVGKTGAVTIGGVGASTVFTVSAGDAVLSDGSLVITDADNAASLSVTNDTATTANVVAIAGSGVFTGSTTGSFVTITPSGLTTGTAVYLVAAGLTTGKGLHAVGNALTTGELVHLEHTTSVIADGGSILRISSTSIDTGGATNGTLLDLSSTSQVAGSMVKLVAGAVTTGVLVDLSSTTGLTSGSLIRATSATAGAIATNGAISFTATGNFTSASNVGFLSVQGDSTTAGTIANISGNALTTGVALYVDNGTSGMTSGSLISVAAGGTGTVATNGIVSIKHAGIYGSTSNAGLLDVGADATTAGTVVHFTASAAGQATNQILNITQSGVTTGYTGNVVQITASSTTGASNALAVIGVNTTAGNVVSISNNALTLGTGTLLNLSHTTSVLGAGSSMLRISSTGIDTGTTTGVLLDLSSTASTAATQVLATFSALTTGTGVSIATAALTTGTALLISAVEATIQTTGYYLRCFDGAANDFSISKYGATVIAGNAIGTAALTVTAGDFVLTSGNAFLGGKVIFNGTETIVAGGTSTALSLTKSLHYIDADAGGDTFTLADGVNGQVTTILLTSSTGIATITPANLAGGTSVTLNADGDSVVLQFMDTEWFILGGNSYAVV